MGSLVFNVRDEANNSNYLTRIKQVSETEVLISQRGLADGNNCNDVVLIDIPKLLLAMSCIEGFGDAIVVENLNATYKDIWQRCCNGKSKE